MVSGGDRTLGISSDIDLGRRGKIQVKYLTYTDAGG